MSTKRIQGWALAVAAALAAGCGSGGGTSATTGPAPSPIQKASAQQADAGSSPIEQTADASNSAIVENGAPGSTSAQTGLKSSTTGTTINFQATVNVTVDLDALNSSGQDAFPNASGKFSVSATGTLSGDSSAGQATYAVTVTWLTNGVFTDPVCGASATVLAGSTWSYSLVVQWSKTDDLNWSIQATSDVNGSVNGTVTSGGTTWTVTGTVTRHESLTFSQTAGTYAFTFGITGQRTVVVTDGTETHTVVITISALDHIVIEIDGVLFGPYTLAQIRWWFGFDCNA